MSRQVNYVRLDSLVDDEANPKAHDVEVIDESVGRFGMVDLIVQDGRTGKTISGHGRTKTLRAMHSRGESPPEGVQVDEDGEWLVPVVNGWSSRTDLEARAALIALNRTTEMGGWVDDSLLKILDDLAQEDDGFLGVGFSEKDLAALSHLVDNVGTRDLDALAEEFGEPTEEDELIRVVLRLPKDLADRLHETLGMDPAEHEKAARRLLGEE